MNPRDPRPEHQGADPACNDTHTDRWLNSTGYATPNPGAARVTVEALRRQWQHHVERLRRTAWTVIAVAATVMITITVVAVVQPRSATRCALSGPATMAAVTP